MARAVVVKRAAMRALPQLTPMFTVTDEELKGFCCPITQEIMEVECLLCAPPDIQRACLFRILY